jgi:hypothetical protein
MSTTPATVEKHFVAKPPALRAVYDRLKVAVSKFGD